MVNYVLKKVSSQATSNSQLYREKFEFALTNFDKVQRDRKIESIKRKLHL